MGIFGKIKSTVGLGNELTEKDLIELRDECRSAIEKCDRIIDKIERNREHRVEGIVTGDNDSITYIDFNNYHTFNIYFLPDYIEPHFKEIVREFDPRKADSISEARMCFNEHEQFAESVIEICEEVLEDIEDIKDRMDRVEYMEDADDNFEHNGFEHPANSIDSQLSSYVDSRVNNSDSGEGGNGSMEKMDINQMVLFIAEELRRKRDDEYDVELYNSLYSGYTEESELVREMITGRSEEGAVRNILDSFGYHRELFPLKDEHIEHYIIPRVFHGIPSKTPQEIGML